MSCWSASAAAATARCGGRALKVVRRDRFGSERPYEREFAGIQKFDPISRRHEGVVDILHLGRAADGSHFYYVMELADDVSPEVDVPSFKPTATTSGGESPTGLETRSPDSGTYVPKTLRAVLKARGRLPLGEVIELGVAMCNALGHLHRHGLVHRDVKPTNLIFVGGRPKLADIGLVTGIDEAKSFVGTEGYIPPEGPGSVQADPFSVGKVLYEAATGKDRHDFPELPEEFRGTPEGEAFAELNEVLLRACATVPAQRHASAEQMRAELLLLQAGQSVRGLRANERLLRRLKLAALIGAALVVLAAAAALLQRQRATERAAQIRVLTEKDEQRRQTAYAADLAIAYQSWDAGRAELTRQLLDGQRPADGQEDLRGWEWRHLGAQARPREVRRVTTESPFGFWSCELSPDGRTAAGGTVDGYVVLWDPRTGTRIRQLGQPGRINPVDSLAFSSDGAMLFQSLRLTGEVAVWDVASGQSRLRFGPGRTGLKLALSPNNALLATADGPAYVATGPGELQLWEAATGREVARAPAQPTFLVRVEFTPDGKHLGVGGGRGYARVWSVPDLREVAVLPHENEQDVFGFAFSPDGRRLATGTTDGLVRVWDWASRRLLAVWMGHPSGCDAAAWSPDGRTLATGGRDQIVLLWSVTNQTELAAFKGHAGRVNGLAFSPDGQRLVSASEDKTMRSWAVPAAVRTAPVRSWRPSTSDPELALSPDSRWLALAGLSNRVELRTLPGLDVAMTLPRNRPVFSPDGRWLVTHGTNRLELSTLPDGRPERVFAAGEPLAGTPAFAPDAARLAMATATGGVLLWELTNSVPARRVAGTNRLEGLFFASGGREVVTLHAADGALEWFNVATGERTRRLATGEGSVTSAALSPDGQSVLIGETAARLRLVDLATGRVELLPGDTGSVLSVAWSADGQTVAAGTFEGFLKLWNVRTRRELAALRGHLSMVTALEFSRDGRHLVSGSVDNTWRVWSAPALASAPANCSASSVPTARARPPRSVAWPRVWQPPADPAAGRLRWRWRSRVHRRCGRAVTGRSAGSSRAASLAGSSARKASLAAGSLWTWLGRGTRRLCPGFSQAVIQAAQGQLHPLGPGQPALQFGHAAPPARPQALLQLRQRLPGELAGPAGVVAPRVIHQRGHPALPVAAEPRLEGVDRAAHGQGDRRQPQFALQAQLHGLQALARRARRFRLQAARHQVRLALHIQLCSRSCHPQRLARPPHLCQYINVVCISPWRGTCAPRFGVRGMTPLFLRGGSEAARRCRPRAKQKRRPAGTLHITRGSATGE